MALSIFATIEPKPEHFADAREAILGIVDRTRAEPGCVAFDLHEDAGGGRLHLMEVWRDRAALEAHHGEAYTRGVFLSYETWLAKPLDLIAMQPVG